MKRKLAGILALSLVVGSCLMPSADSQAAKIKLNKKTATIKVGKKVTLKVKGTKKKAKWSSSKKSVATVSKKGVVKGKKAGKATITAKIGKKKYRCKVTVQAVNKSTGSAPSNNTPKVPTTNQPSNSNVNSISTDQLAANIDVKVDKILSGVMMTVTNRNTVWVDYVKVNYSLCNAAGVPVQVDYISFSDVKPGGTQQRTIYVTDSDRATLDLSKTTVSKTVDYYSLYTFTDRSSSILCTSQKTADGDIAYTLKNNAGTDVSGLVNIYYYDATGKMVDADYNALSMQNNETKMDTFTPPYTYDDDYNKVYVYSTYKIVVTASSYVVKSTV